MKKIYYLIMLFLFCCLASACGREEAAEYYDIQSESAPFFDVADSLSQHGYFLGAQFYQEEPIQLWAIRTAPGSEKADVFLYRMDGSRELLFQALPEESFFGARSYLDSQGNLYHFYNITISLNHSQKVLLKMNPSGELLYRYEEEGRLSIRDICQLQDGRIFLNYSGSSASGWVCGELNTDTGVISNVTSFVYDSIMWMGTGGEGLRCLSSDGIVEINIGNGEMASIWPFTGTTYRGPRDTSLRIWDFMITEEGEVQLLWGAFSGGAGIFLETLRRVNAGKGKIPIVMRGTEFAGDDGGWFKDMAARFNQENEHYYIVLEECGLYQDWDDYARQTSVEVSAGKGPDLFYGNVLGEYAYGIAIKGGFLDVSDYLEGAGIKKEDYFPSAFSYYRDGEKIYGITTNITLGFGGYYMDSTVVGSVKEPDMETLLDALLSWQEDAVYMDKTNSQGVLEIFLEGTEDLWGMVDWEEGTCDFNTELFAKILQAAKRYGYDPRNRVPSLVQIEPYFLYNYMDSAIREEEGKVMVGLLFDDGYHAKVTPGFTLAVNVNSAQKDGAWEFIRFLLSEEAQAWSFGDSGVYPVSRKAFHALIEKEQAEGRVTTDSFGHVRSSKGLYDLTDSRVKELEEVLEGARFLPVRTIPILEIIYDEAQDYFDGMKGIDEISVLINNRVQLYLNENR